MAQNDLFYANIGKDMFQHGPFGNRSHTLNYFFPVGYWAFSASYNDYTYHQNIPNANEVLRYSGKSDNIQLTSPDCCTATNRTDHAQPARLPQTFH